MAVVHYYRNNQDTLKAEDRVPRRSRHGVLDVLLEIPWWAGVAAAVVVYVVFALIVPAVFPGNSFIAGLKQGAPFIALICLIPAPFAGLRHYRRKKLLDTQADIASIQKLHWKEFEKLVAEVFRRIGYTVMDAGTLSAGVAADLVATAPHEEVLVQCEHRRSVVVGVMTVRELIGVVTAEGATGGALVTSGSFTEDAVAFAADKPLQLIDGDKLEKLVRTVRSV